MSRLRFLRQFLGRRPFWLIGAGAVIGVLLLLLLSSQSAGRFFPASDRTWQSIQAGGQWRVGMDPSFPPFESLDGTGQPVGYDVDLVQAIAARWGVEVEIVPIGFDGLIDALQVGRIDSVVSALPFDPRLTQDVRYSSPYFEAGTRLVVPAGSPIRSTEDLAGRSLAVEWGSAGDAAARRLQQEDPSIRRTPYRTPDEAVAAFLAAETDALLIDGVTLRLVQGEGAAVVAVGPPLEGDPYVIAVPLDAPLVHRAIEQALDELRAEGILEELEARWFTSAP